jgi:hypothetical protein
VATVHGLGDLRRRPDHHLDGIGGGCGVAPGQYLFPHLQWALRSKYSQVTPVQILA